MVKCMADINLLSVDSGSIFVYILNVSLPRLRKTTSFHCFPM